MRNVYRVIPGKRHLFSLLRRVYIPPRSVYQHLHFDGPFTTHVAGATFRMHHGGLPVENEIFWKGVTRAWEPVSLSLWIALCRTARVIFDVGANTGMYTLVAQAVQPAGEVYAFEPVPRVFARLQANCALNGYAVSCFNVAVSNHDGHGTLYDTTDPHVYVATLQAGTSYADVTVQATVPTLRLDTFLRDCDLERLDLIKIDTEGHELEVLEGLGRCLAQLRPSMLIEVLSDEAGARIEALLPSGYSYFNIDEQTGAVRVPSIRKSRTYNHLVCDASVARRLELS